MWPRAKRRFFLVNPFQLRLGAPLSLCVAAATRPGPAARQCRGGDPAHAAAPLADGTTHLRFDPLELLERLAVLTLRPRVHLILYYGVLAPRAAWRAAIVASAASMNGAGADPPTADTVDHADSEARRGGPSRSGGYQWAELMRRTIGFDVLACPRCGGRLRLVALIEHVLSAGSSPCALYQGVPRPRSATRRKRRLALSVSRTTALEHVPGTIGRNCTSMCVFDRPRTSMGTPDAASITKQGSSTPRPMIWIGASALLAIVRPRCTLAPTRACPKSSRPGSTATATEPRPLAWSRPAVTRPSPALIETNPLSARRGCDDSLLHSVSRRGGHGLSGCAAMSSPLPTAKSAIPTRVMV